MIGHGTSFESRGGTRGGFERGLNQQTLRRVNEVALLRLLRIHGPTSRVELAAQLGLDTKTLTNLSRDLLRRNLVKPSGMTATGRRGRPRELLQLRASELNAIGLHLEERRIRGALVGLDGSIRERHLRHLTGTENRTRLKRLVVDMARELSSAAQGQTLGTGLTIPGIVDHRTGLIVESTHLPGWVGVNVATLLKGVCRGPVRVEDFTPAKALAERWFGAGTDVDDFVLLDVGEGIGCAIVSQGRLHTGQSHIAGEIGHVVVSPDGEMCGCGHRGCLETVASLNAMLKHAGLSRDRSGSLPQDVLAKRLLAGDASAKQAVERAGRSIGLVLSTIVAALNPSRVVLAGDALALDPLFTNTVRESVEAFTLPAITRDLTVVASQLGQDAALLGAAVLGLQSIFKV